MMTARRWHRPFLMLPASSRSRVADAACSDAHVDNQATRHLDQPNHPHSLTRSPPLCGSGSFPRDSPAVYRRLRHPWLRRQLSSPTRPPRSGPGIHAGVRATAPASLRSFLAPGLLRHGPHKPLAILVAGRLPSGSEAPRLPPRIRTPTGMPQVLTKSGRGGGSNRPVVPLLRGATPPPGGGGGGGGGPPPPLWGLRPQTPPLLAARAVTFRTFPPARGASAHRFTPTYGCFPPESPV
jgi:hypothetical protein